MTSVPEDIVRDVLLKLPVKPLLRFKCLSKSWYSLISSPDFIKLHLHLSLQSNHREKFAVYDFIPNEYMTFDAPNNFKDIISEESTFIIPPLKPMKHQYPFLDKHDILCSCDGLLLVKTCVVSASRYVIALWNPSTRESRELPNCEYHSYYALGYDSSTDDYKVIEQAYTYHGYSDQVFSLRSNSWRKIKDFKSDMRLRDFVYINLNGAMHWLKPNLMRKNIVCFTLAEETFLEMEIELPHDFDTCCTSDVNLCALQGSLCLSALYSDLNREAYSLNVWLMKEYGVKASWTKFVTIPHLPIKYPSFTCASAAPFCFMKKKAIFIIKQRYRDSMFVICDLDKEEFQIVEIAKNQNYLFTTYITFVESLVSPYCQVRVI